MGLKARARLRPVLAAVFPLSVGVAVLVAGGLLFGRGAGSRVRSAAPASNLGKLIFSSLIRSSQALENGEDSAEGMRAWLKGCRYLYLDVGSNVGIQVRKLFEPKWYPQALVGPIYDEAFGKAEDRVGRYPQELCAVGWEPNPHNAAALQQLEAAYRKQGWRVKFFTETAASTVDGEADLFLDGDAPLKYHQPGSSLIASRQEQDTARVRTMDLAAYLLQEVAARELEDDGEEAEDRPPPAVVMKVDVEGLEHTLLPHLIITGALCQAKVDLVLYEGHLWNEWASHNGTTDEAFVDFFTEFVAENGRNEGGGCPTEIRLFDDETYDTTQRPLPK